MIATAKTDECGHFCVWIPRWDIDWVLRFRRERRCYGVIFHRPTIRELIEQLRPLPDPEIQWPPRPIPEPDPPPYINPLDRSALISKAIHTYGQPVAERINEFLTVNEFGASMKQPAVHQMAAAPLAGLAPPLPRQLRQKLRDGNGKDAGERQMESNKLSADVVSSLASEAGINPKLLAKLDLRRYIGPFFRCYDVIVPVWTPLLDIPDITFRVHQDTDGDGNEEVIYGESHFDVRWNSGPLPDQVIEAWPNALAGNPCGPINIPCGNTPAIVMAGRLRTNRPRSDGSFDGTPEPGRSPLRNTLALYGCNRTDANASHYRITYRFSQDRGASFTSAKPFTGLTWPLYRLNAGGVDFRFERCSGPLVMGDLAYTTTLLPGENVRLFTSDRHNRWSYDSSSQLAYRHETTSEEAYYTWGMARALSDLSISESGSSSSSYEEDWASGGGSASVNFLGIIKIGGGGGGGSYDANSSRTFAQNLSRHAESSSSYVVGGVRAKSATSIGEVEQRTHAEGESESHLESSSRLFRNANRCRALTYFFYKINKLQRIRFRLVAIERSIDDPAAPTNPDRRLTPDLTGNIAVRRQAVLATDEKRLTIERTAREAAVERERASHGQFGGEMAGLYASRAVISNREPLPLEVREAALKELDAELVKAGLLEERTGKPSDKIIAELSWEREEMLPTPGILVKGCLDDCNTCEPSLQQKIELELEEQSLKNLMLKRQIELLDKAQEYRCCPVGEAEEENEPDDV